jgi:hypothetical protein
MYVFISIKLESLYAHAKLMLIPYYPRIFFTFDAGKGEEK